MGIERIDDIKIPGSVIFALILLSLCYFYPLPVKAQSSVVVQNPLNSNLNSPFGMRDGRRHTGIDLRARTPTNVPITRSARCYLRGGYGLQGQVAHACGVVEAFSHLSQCDANTIITGSSGDTSGRQGVAEPHLHYEISLNGTFVDPMKAFGQNLCEDSVRQSLIADARNSLNGQAGGGGAAGAPAGNQPAPPVQPTDNIVQVPTGGVDPRTGIVNTGPEYYVVTTPDGRVYQERVPGDEPSIQTTLPPTTSDVVLPGSGSGEITGCAADTWTAMVNQAVLQARREHVMNARYIAKADTVLSYSCFSEALVTAGQNAGIFSESNAWMNRQIDILGGSIVQVNMQFDQYALDGALTNAALEPYESFIRAYFNHGFLGGLLGPAGNNNPVGFVESDSSQSRTPCGIMAQVWQQAKCMNVSDDPMFYKFSDLIGNDPRKYPPSYTCFDTGITQSMIDIAQNKSAQFSRLDTHMNKIYPKNGHCAPAIPTGITVHRRKGGAQISSLMTYPDGLCPTVGCSYQNGGGNSAGTCQIKGP